MRATRIGEENKRNGCKTIYLETHSHTGFNMPTYADIIMSLIAASLFNVHSLYAVSVTANANRTSYCHYFTLKVLTSKTQGGFYL